MKDNEISIVVNELTDIAKKHHNSQQLRTRISNIIVPLLKPRTFQEDMNMKQEENLVSVKIGNLKKSALNYMVAKALGYSPRIVGNNEYKHTVRVDGPSSNPYIKFEMGKLPMQDSFDIYSNPTLVGEFLFNALYKYTKCNQPLTNNTYYKATTITTNNNLIVSYGDTPVEAGFILLVMERLGLLSALCMIEIPKYLAEQSGLLIKQDN